MIYLSTQLLNKQTNKKPIPLEKNKQTDVRKQDRYYALNNL